MILISDLRAIIARKLADAKWLIKGNRFDSAVYLCGYCLEIAFKIRLCKDANRADFPETKDEFKSYSLNHWKIHDLKGLAELCNLYGLIKKKYRREWSTVQSAWNVEMRYKTSLNNKDDAIDFINAIRTLLRVIL
ncbi:MAG: hypothetical protein WAX77_06420 [Methylococcaceae bacterium]